MPMSLKNNHQDLINIMIRGIGGQGVKLAGTIIGQAALFDGRSAVQGMQYGSAITGGETRSEIKVSTKPIIYPRITDIDVYVALTLQDLQNYFEAKIYLAASEIAKIIPEPIKEKIILAPLIEMAEKIGSIQAANMILIGILNQLFNIANIESFIKSIKEEIPPKYHEVNIQGFMLGQELDLKRYNNKKVLEYAQSYKLKG